jgi:dTDP-4-amino-4,6-dideoxygalactose transaminase
MPVHQFGLPADMPPILEFAERHGLIVLEDAACALGASYGGHPCGALARIACFSFHPRKVVTTGEGGMITTDDQALADFCRLWRNHGMATLAGRRLFVAPGYNFRMSELSAVLGLAQMQRLDALVQRRRELAHRLTEALRNLPWLRPPVEPADRLHSYQSYAVLLEAGVQRESVIAQLDTAGIEAAPGAEAIHAQPYFRERFGTVEGTICRSAALYRRALLLPLYSCMTDADLEWVVQTLRQIEV